MQNQKAKATAITTTAAARWLSRKLAATSVSQAPSSAIGRVQMATESH